MKGVGQLTPLIVAANEGLTDFYKCLLDAGADPDVCDDVRIWFLLFLFASMCMFFTPWNDCLHTGCLLLAFRLLNRWSISWFY